MGKSELHCAQDLVADMPRSRLEYHILKGIYSTKNMPNYLKFTVHTFFGYPYYLLYIYIYECIALFLVCMQSLNTSGRGIALQSFELVWVIKHKVNWYKLMLALKTGMRISRRGLTWTLTAKVALPLTIIFAHHQWRMYVCMYVFASKHSGSFHSPAGVFVRAFLYTSEYV